MDNMTKQIPYDEMMPATGPAYQKHFTKGDMDALVAFYSVPTGQKLFARITLSHSRKHGVHDADHAQEH
jgi:hypothetical protein